MVTSYKITDLCHKRFLDSRSVFAMDLVCSLIASAFVILLINLIIPDLSISRQLISLWLGISIIASFLGFWLSSIHRAIIRYSTLREIGRISLAVFIKEILLYLGMVTFSGLEADSGLLIGMIFVDFFVSLCTLLLLRMTMIMAYDRIKAKIKEETGIHRVIIYGVSEKAASAMSRLRNSPHYNVVGFITYGKGLKDHHISGLRVNYFDNADDVKRIAEAENIDGVLFPYVADAREEQSRLIAYCQKSGLKTYIIPGIDEMAEGKLLSNCIRKVKIEDLLGRPEIKISMKEIIENFQGKAVMVTGAAGSIGSELCRQLASFGVRQLILFDNAETPLHNIRLELEDRFPHLNFIPVIGDVRSQKRLDFVFRNYQPQIVFHAAAYKHVPLMEENPCEAVRVNVTGSRQVADKCVEYGVERMVMVSTDKAVNPTNIMGCTKRLAEIYVQSLGLAIEKGEVEGKTKFVTTRFGNVLGSNGSVIPRFKEQLEHGGPLTVTHPEINRYFMTIPEACRLVMEAATFATGTQIFVFDMGEPVKIVTLAERMIKLAGLEVGRDIDIEFTGLRPGEKLYEEVLATKENTLPTSHDRIFVAKVREYSHNESKEAMENLNQLAMDVDIPNMVKFMKRTVPEYHSENSEFEKYDVR